MCAPASLKIILDYYGINKSEFDLADLLGIEPGIGTDAESLVRVATRLGFKAEIKNEAGFADIENWLAKNVPVIVDWFTRGRSDYDDSETADGHYSVAVGLDDEYIYLQDPEIGKERKIKRGDFMRVWFDFKGTCIKSANTAPEELVVRQMVAVYK